MLKYCMPFVLQSNKETEIEREKDRVKREYQNEHLAEGFLSFSFFYSLSHALALFVFCKLKIDGSKAGFKFPFEIAQMLQLAGGLLHAQFTNTHSTTLLSIWHRVEVEVVV